MGKAKANAGAEATRQLTYDSSNGGACCKKIHISLEGDVIAHVEIVSGCPGNHRGIQALVRGRKAQEVIDLLAGTPCGDKGTSCPDQLAKALTAAMRK